MLATAERYGPGRAPRELTPGDFILTHRKSFPSAVIAFGQALRFRGARRPFARWTHAALIVSPDGDLIEALGGGVERTHISRYLDVEYHVVRVDASNSEREHVVAYAQAMADRHEAYDWWEIASLGLQLLTSGRFTLTVENHAICSGLIATALERTGAIFPRMAASMMPADLAFYYGALSG